MAATVTGQDSLPWFPVLGLSSACLELPVLGGEKSCFILGEGKKHGGSGAPELLLNLLPEAVIMFSGTGLGGPHGVLCPPLLCGSPLVQARPSWEQEQVAKGVWVSVWP